MVTPDIPTQPRKWRIRRGAWSIGGTTWTWFAYPPTRFPPSAPFLFTSWREAMDFAARRTHP